MTGRNVNEPTVRVDTLGRSRISRSLAERVWRRVDKSGGPDACWPFAEAGRNAKGYGVLGGRPKNLAHRVAYEAANGPIPDDLFVLHRCDNPPCCNPAHLFPGTNTDNMRDMSAKGRAADMRNERCGKAKLSDAQIAAIRSRWAAGETQRELTAEYGVSEGHLHRVVSGERRPAEDGSALPGRSPEASDIARSRSRQSGQPSAGAQVRAAKRERGAAAREARERQDAEVQCLYESGLSTVKIGKRLGIAPATASAALRRRGIAVRTAQNYLVPVDREAVREMHAQGIRAEEMCRRLGVGRHRLYQVFDELDLPRFGSGSPQGPRRQPGPPSEVAA